MVWSNRGILPQGVLVPSCLLAEHTLMIKNVYTAMPLWVIQCLIVYTQCFDKKAI